MEVVEISNEYPTDLDAWKFIFRAINTNLCISVMYIFHYLGVNVDETLLPWANSRPCQKTSTFLE